MGSLGKFVWPSANPGLRKLGVKEEDTEIEKHLYLRLHKHFGAVLKSGAPLDDKSINAIKQIINSGEYDHVFKRCSGVGRVMRGMQVPLKWLRENLPGELDAMSNEIDSLDWNRVIATEFIYKPEGQYGKVSSWTGDLKTAQRFATKYKPDSVPCVFYAECSSGFFLNTLPFARYVGGDYHYDEKNSKPIPKLNPQGKREQELLLFGECVVTAVQIRGTVPKQINENRKMVKIKIKK